MLNNYPVSFQVNKKNLAPDGSCPRCYSVVTHGRSRSTWDLAFGGLTCKRCGYLLPAKHITIKITKL